MPGSEEYDDLERVIAVDDDMVAPGLRGDGFGVWHREADRWSRGEAFGSVPEDTRRSPFVSSLVDGDRGLWATTSNGIDHALWHSADGDEWTPVAMPEAPPETGGERILTVAAAGETVQLLADNGTGGRLWWSTE